MVSRVDLLLRVMAACVPGSARLSRRWPGCVRLVAPLAAVSTAAAAVLVPLAAPAAAASSSPGFHRVPPVRAAPLQRPVPKLPGGGSGAAAGRPLPKPVREIVADRTATTSTWQNADGTLSVRRYLVPHFYRSRSGGWLPVRPVLVPAAGRAGWWDSRAAGWRA